MSTHGSLRGGRKLAGFLTVVLAFLSPAAGEVIVPQDGWRLRPGCENECELLHVSGDVLELPPSVIATPIGTSYSVHHRVGADLDGNGPQNVTCFFIHNPALPGAPDDIVSFNELPEAIRTDLLGTVPMVNESDIPQPNGRRLLTMLTESPTGTDLFPAGFVQAGMPLTDACFSIGLVDALTWVGSDTIVAATIEFLIDDVLVVGPFDAISFFSDPWNGIIEITLPNGAGDGFNGVRLSVIAEKSLEVPNDDCRGRIQVFNGDTQFSNIGATTDGPDEAECNFFSYTDIGSDIWYRYTPTCTGNLTIDLCNSDYDTKFAVYDGCLQCPIQNPPLACNDDFCSRQSFATVPVVTGQCVMIRIGGYQGVQGTGTMTLSCDVIPPPSGACCDDENCLGTMSEANCVGANGTWYQGESCPGFACPITPPPNDLCADAIRVETGVLFEGRTRAATGTDITSCVPNDRFDVWHFWTADCTGRVSITTCGSFFDTTLAAYNNCGGIQLACDDDGCQTFPTARSMVTFDVTEGTTYYIRVAGYNGLVGDYKLNVETCKNACCLKSGLCGLATNSQCEIADGTALGPGSLCRGDLDNNSIDDACEPCPEATIAGSAPQSGTVDARQPYSSTSALPRQGIGSPGETGAQRESIIIVLNPRVPDAEGCFALCETLVDPILGANAVSSVSYHGAGVYELELNHAITAGGVTTIEYLGDGSFIEYVSHPSNVDGGPFDDGLDVGAHVDCCLRGLCTPAWGAYSCETNRSLLTTPADTLGVIDLKNGAQVWEPWTGPLPTRGSCP